MILSYKNIGDDRRVFVNAEVTTDHPASSYGQSVIVLEDVGALDLISWVALDYRVEDATPDEVEKLIGIFGNIHTETRQ